MKRIKSCITNNQLLAQALCSSSKLVVSNDGKRVRPKHPFTEKDKEELQLHALVEYETAEMAEKAPKSVLKTRKSEFDGLLDDEIDEEYDLPEECSQNNVIEPAMDNHAEEGSKKGWPRGRGKSKIRTSGHNGRGVLSQSPLSSGGSPHSETSSSPKLSPKGPRMPDGTRGFTMGRGKPMSPPVLTITL